MSTNTNQWPANMESPRRHYQFGIFWPIVLIALGVVLLLNNINVLQGNVWDWIMRLWPIILVAWGLDGFLRGEFVGSALLLGIGAIFLLANAGWLTLNIWDAAIRLWPIFLVSAGLGLIFNRRWAGGLGAIIGALLMLVVVAVSLWLVGGRIMPDQIGAPVAGQRITQALNGASKAVVSIDPAAGSLHLQALPEATSLLEGTINLQNDEYINRTFSMDDGTANLRLKGEGMYFGVGPIGPDWHNWALSLNPDIPTALRINQGAGDATLDLTNMNLSGLSTNLAVGSMNITLPQSGQLSANINEAIGTTTIIVPAQTGVRIQISGGLVTTDVPGNFQRIAHNIYTSPNYDTSPSKMDLLISQAIGSITVRTQTGR
jgi:predicted membrane protein